MKKKKVKRNKKSSPCKNVRFMEIFGNENTGWEIVYG